MKHLNRQSIQTLLQQIFKLLFCLNLLLCIVSCEKKVDGIELKYYFDDIYIYMNLEPSKNQVPVFNKIDSSSYYFDVLQSLADWEILQEEDEFDLEDYLTHYWFIKTFSRIEDVSFEDGIQIAKNRGYIEIYDEDYIMDKSSAINNLKDIVNKRNNQIFEPIYEFEEVNIIDQFDIIDIKDNMFKIDTQNSYEVDDYLYRDDQYFHIIDKNDDGWITYEICEDPYEDIHIEDSFEVEFNDVEIVPNEEIYVFQSLDNTHLITPLQSFSGNISLIDGYKVTYSASNSRLSTTVTKDLPHGSKLYGTISISKIHPSYKYTKKHGKVEEAYLKIDYQTSEEFGLKNGIGFTKNMDFSELKGKDFLNIATNLFKNQKDVVEASLELFSIKVPVKNVPTVKIVLSINLNIYTSGRIEIALKNKHEDGFEYKNGNFRTIHDVEHTTDFIIKGNASITTGILTGIEIAKQDIMNILVKAGIKADMNSTIHLYDDQKDNAVNSDIPLDLLETMENGNAAVCADLNLYKMVDLEFNTSKTTLAKLGLNYTKSLINEKNGSLLNGKHHIEHGIFVEKCTRGDRLISKTESELMKTDRIIIDDYSLLVHLNTTKRIIVTGLPEGYSMSDINYICNNSCVNVDNKGNVTGLNEGNSVITIQTKDGKYNVNCHVLVTS